MRAISIHALLTESDAGHLIQFPRGEKISIHALLTESDSFIPVPIAVGIYFNPRSPHGERRGAARIRRRTDMISIHALLTESDHLLLGHLRALYPISIHALLTESDVSKLARLTRIAYFNPRSPHGERRIFLQWRFLRHTISIHALLTESDVFFMDVPHFPKIFQSTLSSRRATGCTSCPISGGSISIHALLTESDDRLHVCLVQLQVFQSTLSSRRATTLCRPERFGSHISIHALLTESDFRSLLSHFGVSNFNPRSPHGERPWKKRPFLSTLSYFNPRSPHGERPSRSCFGSGGMEISIHALLTESDATAHQQREGLLSISIHALLTESDQARPCAECV